MGTGKSTVGRLLADRLGYSFADTDQLIEQRHGPIPVIFEAHGEPGFRRLERDLAAELGTATATVISTGGRMLLDPPNAEALGATGIIICLSASVDTLVERLRGSGAETRPLLAGHDLRARVGQLLEDRAPAYSGFTQILTDDKTPDQIVDEIIAGL